MIWLTTRTATSLAVTLVVAMQAIVSPASCCLLKSFASHAGTCFHAAPVEATRSCCQHKSAATGTAPGEGHDPVRPKTCPICTGTPKIVAADRVEAPSPARDGLFGLNFNADAVASDVVGWEAPATALEVDEPFRRTALASCAWLCVWRI
jgi:hypothetical protein